MTTQLQYGMGGDRPYSLYYQHSGKTPISSIVLAGLAGAAAAVVLAVVYGYIDAYCPYAKLRGIATVFFGLGVGGATAAIAKAGKVRSMAVVLALVGAAALVAYYACWVVWIEAAFGRMHFGPNVRLPTYGNLILSPVTFARCIRFFNENGYWSLSSSGKDAPHGIWLTMIWLGEAAAIFGSALVVARATARAQMFCEACNRWCSKPQVLRHTLPGDAGRARQTLEAHDLAYLTTLQPADSPNRFWTLKHERCGRCDDLHALSIEDHKVTLDKKGKVTSNKAKTLVDRLLLDAGEVETLRHPAVPAAPVATAPVVQPASPPPPPPGPPPQSPPAPDPTNPLV